MLKNVSAGWLITTGDLSKDAKGIQTEWETDINSNRSKLSFYTKERIIDLLISSNTIFDYNTIITKYSDSYKISNNVILMLLPNDKQYWVFPLENDNDMFSTSVVVFNAQNGEQIVDEALLNDIK